MDVAAFSGMDYENLTADTEHAWWVPWIPSSLLKIWMRHRGVRESRCWRELDIVAQPPTLHLCTYVLVMKERSSLPFLVSLVLVFFGNLICWCMPWTTSHSLVFHLMLTRDHERNVYMGAGHVKLVGSNWGALQYATSLLVPWDHKQMNVKIPVFLFCTTNDLYHKVVKRSNWAESGLQIWGFLRYTIPSNGTVVL
jgi:hypothetical protein